ncbi:MAG: PilZ domain-containing protein [Thermoanaerobaculia bacterium]|jgi:hypothetical protein
MTELGPVVIEPALSDRHDRPRDHPRHKVDRVSLEEPIKGRIVDLSESGLGIESSQQLEVLGRYVFRLSTGKARPEFLGEVRWCKLESLGSRDGKKAPIYRAGVALLER